MIDFITVLYQNFPFFMSMVLFSLGCLIILTQNNLIKKVIGINIMETSIFHFFIASGNFRGGVAPILDPEYADALYVNPLPQALVLTGIVVGFSITVFALAIIVGLYRFYGTIYVNKLMKMR